MKKGVEAWQLAFAQFIGGDDKAIIALAASIDHWDDFEPLIGFSDQQELPQAVGFERLFVSKNEYSHLYFGDSEPEVVAPFCFLMGCYQRGVIDIGRALEALNLPPTILVQIGLLPKSWAEKMPVSVDNAVMRNLDSILEDLRNCGLPAADYVISLGLLHGQSDAITQAVGDGLSLTASSIRALRASGACSSAGGGSGASSGLLYSSNFICGDSGDAMFLKACTVGLISIELAEKFHAAGLSLAAMPFPLASLEDVENYYSIARYHASQTTPDHMRWVERTYLNALSCFFATGNDEAMTILSNSIVCEASKQALINDWGISRPGAMARLHSSQIDAKLGIDLGL